jgi:hypothetical protein
MNELAMKCEKEMRMKNEMEREGGKRTVGEGREGGVTLIHSFSDEMNWK